MPDFAPNATARYRLKYNVAGRVHTTGCRHTRGIDSGTLQAEGSAYIRSIFDALKSEMADDLAFISAEYALTDSDLFFPATVPAAVVGALSAADFSKQDGITHLTFSGRGAGGSRANVKIYGVQTDPDDPAGTEDTDFILLSAERATVANAVAALNTSPGGRIVAIDNTVAVYHARATIKVNDFWLRQLRKGL